MQSERILVINPGNTSTKVAVYDGTTPVCVESVKHADADLAPFPDINSQREFREKVVLDFLARKGIAAADLRAIAARGGLLKPVASGTYVVDQKMVDDLFAARQGVHASNLAGQIGFSLANKLGITCYIVDPVSVDEAEPLARYSGHSAFQRVMLTHALNLKAVAKRFCKERNLPYTGVTLIVTHLGTGTTVSLQHNGRMIDASNPSEDGPFSVDRSGGLPIRQVARYIIENQVSYKDFEKLVFGNSGLFSYLGSKDFLKIGEKYLAGDAPTMEAVQAMAYQLAKEIGGLATVVNGKVDAIIFTGGIAYNDFFIDLLRPRISFLAPVYVYPGEDEMQALAEGVTRVLRGEEAARTY